MVVADDTSRALSLGGESDRQRRPHGDHAGHQCRLQLTLRAPKVCNNAMKRVTAFAVLLVVLAAPAWAGFDEGVAAYKRGDDATALREFRVLAAQGSVANSFEHVETVIL